VSPVLTRTSTAHQLTPQAHGAASIYACTSSGVETNLPASDTASIIHYPHLEASEHSILALIDEALNAFGRLDVWVCASIVSGPASITSTTPSDLMTTFEHNAMSAFFALRHAPAAMEKLTSKGLYGNAAPKDQRYGSIIVVTSTASEKATGGPAFTIACHAALGVVRSGVAVLKGSGVRINAISYGGIDMKGEVKAVNGNGTVPVGSSGGLERTGSPAEVGRVAGFLASGFSSYITGSNLKVDGGESAL
jgi:NAD(P)-dependent dehydrogenase (short-subunit alcohol dehydrogenase family)